MPWKSQVCARLTQGKGWKEAYNLLPGSCRLDSESWGDDVLEKMAQEMRRLQLINQSRCFGLSEHAI